MKKTLTLLLVFMLCLGAVSCGRDNNTTGNNGTAENITQNNGTGTTGGTTNEYGGTAGNDNAGTNNTNPVRLNRDLDEVAKHLNLRNGTDTLYDVIGAKAGKEYNEGKVELYHFDKNSAEYEAIRKGEGNVKAAAYNDGFVLLFTDKTDEAMVREFKRIEFK